jgi:adenosylcobyric acid synthase
VAARSLLVCGTTSHAGKSWMATAICRHLKNRGLRVAPFKAQNMSNNSYPAADGGEIGRAQAAQAAACGIEPTTDMNPILMKPNSDTGSQIVLNGRVWSDLSATAYYDHFDFFLQCVLDSYARLASRYDFIVIEGAGSAAEVNLRDRDLVNFGLATRVSSPALLVADIDRGGVFGSVIGTVALLQKEECALLRSFAINRFRGRRELFEDGVSFLEERTGKPCLGVFPWARIALDEEDAVTVEDARATGADVAIIRLPRISNFTDFDRIEADWIDSPVRRLYTHVIVPGTKNTTGDLEWLRGTGIDTWIARQHAAGAIVVGVCGGYQMLGESIAEGATTHKGLGLLPVATVMRQEKTVRRVAAPFGEAYEIHVGETHATSPAEPFTEVDGRPEGIRFGRCFGTYLHDALRRDGVLDELGIKARPAAREPYDDLAAWFENNADIKLFEELYL